MNNRVEISRCAGLLQNTQAVMCRLRNNSPHQHLATEGVSEQQNVRIVATRMVIFKG